jgi:hypothetical protein
MFSWPCDTTSTVASVWNIGFRNEVQCWTEIVSQYLCTTSFVGETLPCKATIYNILKSCSTGSMLNKKFLMRYVMTEEKFGDISAWLEASLKKLLCLSIPHCAEDNWAPVFFMKQIPDVMWHWFCHPSSMSWLMMIKSYGHFMQDYAVGHTANSFIDVLDEIFSE